FIQQVFGDKYHEYWESRKDSTLKEDVNNDTCSGISSVQRLVHQNLLFRTRLYYDVFSTSSSSYNCPTANASFSDATSSGLSTLNGLTKTLAQTIELASD
ncbi:hypothetical protein BD408DRAFT_315648, partial [Parasitella parasitica]